MKTLQDFKDELARECFGETSAEVQAKGLCISCKELALPKCYSSAGKSEYRISGMCEQCFDAMFSEEK